MMRSTILPFAILATTASACTFLIETSQNAVNWGGSNTVSCHFRAFLSDDPDFWNDTPDAYDDELPCDGGEGTLNINGNDWTLTYEGLADDLKIGGTATIEGLSTETIYPDAEESSYLTDNPFASTRGYWFWRSDIAC